MRRKASLTLDIVKITQQLQHTAVLPHETPTVLVLSGALCPVHKMHIECLEVSIDLHILNPVTDCQERVTKIWKTCGGRLPLSLCKQLCEQKGMLFHLINQVVWI